MMSSIDTAIPLIENCAERPLILAKEDDYSETHNIDLGDVDHKKYNEHNNRLNSTTAIGLGGQRLLTSWQFLSGFWLGFVIQTVSLGSTAIIEIFYGALWMSKTYEFFFFFFFLLSHSWWLLFPVICISINSGLTGSQRQGILEKYFLRSSPSESDSLSQPSQREVFLGSIRFHAGLVLGCFIVWSMIDLYFGASIGVFATLTASFLACLGLCYGMVVVFDRFIIDEEQQRTRQSLFEEI
jgi:hypothetical protein